MKYFIGLLSIVLLFVSCSKDDKSNDPEINLGDLIIDQTVTSAGADLVSGDFSLTIPEGTFSTATPVKVSKLVETPFSSDAVSPLYFITDLPPSSGQPIVIKLSGLNLSEPLTVFFAEVTHVKSLDSTITVYRKIEHQEIDGKIVVTIPKTPSIYQKSTTPTDEKLTVGLMVAKSQQSLTSSGGHFNLTFPASKAGQAATVAAYLEEAYSTFNSPPFSFDYSNRTSWPMSVTIYPMDNSLYGEQVSSAWGDNYSSISINSDKLNDMPEVRVTAAHEFFHFVQSLYDPRSGFTKSKFASPHYWLDEAVAVWSEEYFTDVQGYISKARAGNELAPFEGGLNDSKPDARGYGYGMSTSVKHMVTRYGVEKIKLIYEKIRTGSNAGEAIRLGLGLGYSYNEWYGTMIQEYCRGSIYSDISTSYLIGSKADEFNINSSADSVKTLSSSYPQLSSKIYSITIKEEALDDESALSIVPDQTFDQWISLFRFKNGTSPLELVGSGSGTVSVNDLKSMVTEGYRFLLVYTNQYYSSGNDPANLSFTVRITQKQLFRAFSFYLTTSCHRTYHHSSGSTSQTGGNWVTQGFTEIPVTQNGNIITASWDGVYGASASTGTATITINDNQTVTAVIHQETYGGVATIVTNCTINSVPLNISNWYADTYQADESYSYIESLYWKETYSTFYIEMDDFYLDPQFPGKIVRLDLFK